MKRVYQLTGQMPRAAAALAVMNAPDGYVCEVKEATRTTDQNSLLWPILGEISQQVDWYGKKLTQDEWKDIFSASLKQQKVVPGLDGAFVVCGQSTSRMGKKEFSDLIELIYAFGASNGVRFTETRFAEAA